MLYYTYYAYVPGTYDVKEASHAISMPGTRKHVRVRKMQKQMSHWKPISERARIATWRNGYIISGTKPDGTNERCQETKTNTKNNNKTKRPGFSSVFFFRSREKLVAHDRWHICWFGWRIYAWGREGKTEKTKTNEKKKHHCLDWTINTYYTHTYRCQIYYMPLWAKI